MSPPVFALVDGGVSTTGAEGKFEGYTGPKMGEVVNRTPFTVNIYTEEKDGDGETTGYLKFTCKHCKGYARRYRDQGRRLFRAGV